MSNLHDDQFEHVPEAHGQGTLFDVPKWREVAMTGREVVVSKPKQHGFLTGPEGDAQAQNRRLYRKAAREGKPAIAMRTETMESMAEGEPRYKSQFETGHSSGYLDPLNDSVGECPECGGRRSKHASWCLEDDDEPAGVPGERARMESKEFGYPTRGMNPRHRPVYGFMKHDDLHTDVDHYGEVTAVLRPHVRDRTTLTFGDSLGGLGDSAKPRPSRLHELTSGEDPGSVHAGFEPSYIEAQYHGGVSVKDIDHFDIQDDHWHAATAADDLGVPWVMRGHHFVGRQPSLFESPFETSSEPTDRERQQSKDMHQWHVRELMRRVAGGEDDRAAKYNLRSIESGYSLSRQFIRHASPGFHSEYSDLEPQSQGHAFQPRPHYAIDEDSD